MQSCNIAVQIIFCRSCRVNRAAIDGLAGFNRVEWIRNCQAEAFSSSLPAW
jgi:hypothetical protein